MGFNLQSQLQRRSANGYKYHVTFTGRLDSIQEQGLQTDQDRAIGNSALNTHCQGKLFFCDWNGVSVWYEKAIVWAEYNSDDHVAEGWVPIVLRLPNIPMSVDDLGETDTGQAAWSYEEVIPPSTIEVWDGTTWKPLAISKIEGAKAVDEEGAFKLKPFYPDGEIFCPASP